MRRLIKFEVCYFNHDAAEKEYVLAYTGSEAARIVAELHLGCEVVCVRLAGCGCLADLIA